MKKLQQILNTRGFQLKEDGVIGPKSLQALSEWVAARCKELGYPTPNGIVALRTDETLTNTFDDFMAYFEKGRAIDVWECSTTAGKYWIQNPVTVGGITGTAILKVGYYPKMWRFVTAQNWATLWLKAPYFQQIRPVTVYRDGDKNSALDTRMTQTGLFGINGHRAGTTSFIDRWSAGCLVTPDSKWFKVLRYFQQGQTVDVYLLNFWV